ALAAILIVHGWEGPWGVAVWAGVVVFAVAFGLLPGLLLQRQVVTRDVERSVGPELRAIFDQLNNAPAQVRIFTVPLYLASATVHFTNSHVRVLTTDSSYAHWTDLTDLLPVLKISMEEVTRRYRLTHLLISERYVTLAEVSAQESDVVLRLGPFCLIELQRVQSKVILPIS
ncbi:MAG: hypothetical protein HY594_05590, partial [Candidatus Omnitrophica bacterium]|nr:hypothetical protein [Candidatus Omnitrophota bacterium]